MRIVFRCRRRIRNFSLFHNAHTETLGSIQPHIHSVSVDVSTCITVEIENSRYTGNVVVITLHSLNRNILLLSITMFSLSFDISDTT